MCASNNPSQQGADRESEHYLHTEQVTHNDGLACVTRPMGLKNQMPKRHATTILSRILKDAWPHIAQILFSALHTAEVFLSMILFACTLQLAIPKGASVNLPPAQWAVGKLGRLTLDEKILIPLTVIHDLLSETSWLRVQASSVIALIFAFAMMASICELSFRYNPSNHPRNECLGEIAQWYLDMLQCRGLWNLICIAMFAFYFVCDNIVKLSDVLRVLCTPRAIKHILEPAIQDMFDDIERVPVFPFPFPLVSTTHLFASTLFSGLGWTLIAALVVSKTLYLPWISSLGLFVAGQVVPLAIAFVMTPTFPTTTHDTAFFNARCVLVAATLTCPPTAAATAHGFSVILGSASLRPIHDLWERFGAGLIQYRGRARSHICIDVASNTTEHESV